MNTLPFLKLPELFISNFPQREDNVIMPYYSVRMLRLFALTATGQGFLWFQSLAGRPPHNSLSLQEALAI